MSNWRKQRRAYKKQKGIKSSPASPKMVAKRYPVPASTAAEIKKIAPTFGSLGRALQVATEILVRMEELPRPQPPSQYTEPNYATYRVHTRTADIIEKLATTEYGNDRRQVFAACVKVLKSTRIKI